MGGKDVTGRGVLPEVQDEVRRGPGIDDIPGQQQILERVVVLAGGAERVVADPAGARLVPVTRQADRMDVDPGAEAFERAGW
ncbi:MAG: hypothetical protein ACYC61_01065 [Isosphaeraceae bacterium]